MSDTPFSKASFKATHNSYSGPFNDFDRGSIPEQLEAGVRFIEFDINWVDYATVGDYQLGHEKPGLEVHHGGGNPSGLKLEDWLRIIATWSDANPGHVPVTVGLDLKNNLAKLRSLPEGNLAALNRHVRNALGDKVFTPRDLGEGDWPSVDELKGKIIVVMSGDTKSRVAYLKDHGVDPAVDMNSRGQVIEVHKSQLNNGLWFWTGAYQDDDSVLWHGHGEVETGLVPVVAINDDGWVVVLHQGARRHNIYYQVGRVHDDGRLDLGGDFKLHGGTDPSVRFVDDKTISMVYKAGGDNYECIGTLDTNVPTVAWTSPQKTDQPRHPVDSAETDGRKVSVSSANDTLLRYSTNGNEGNLGYDHVLFIEYQRGNDDILANTWFYACSKKYLSWGQEKCAAGKLVRIWGFAKEHAIMPRVSYAATDTPYTEWYQSYCKTINTIE